MTAKSIATGRSNPPRPGDPEQRARVIAHYDQLGASYGSEGQQEATGLFGWADRRWNNFARPREINGVMQTIEARSGESILDVGCGSGTYAKRMSALGAKVTAVDASPRMVEAIRPHVAESFQADIETLALGRTFDRVVCLGVLDFVADPATCMRRLADHVSEGGFLIVLAPHTGLLGSYYRVAQRLRGIRVNVFHLDDLDQMARADRFERESFLRPLPNSIAVRWRCGRGAPI